MLKHTVAVLAALMLALAGCGSAPDSGATGGAVSFTVKGGERVAGPEQVEVGVGETVTIEVTSDTADEVHVHGYNKSVELKPGEPATLTFEAAIAGVWEIELHDSGTLLTELRVTQ
ncbi:MAG: hypothetical protein GEV04_08775 [Actinophytocola sp.]|nr:hypothetical protein [Actinophytocola sp.]